MDMRMPVMDGYEATRKIRELPGGEAVKIVAITASAFKEQRSDILAAGCDEVVYKPFKDNEVFEAMAQLLDIEYRYEKYDIAARGEATNLDADVLASIPDELLREFRESLLTLDRESALKVLERITDHAPEAAMGLKELVDNFKMAELQVLLAELEGEN
jgi:DNA-binding response OmpR family regulator